MRPGRGQRLDRLLPRTGRAWPAESRISCVTCSAAMPPMLAVPPTKIAHPTAHRSAQLDEGGTCTASRRGRGKRSSACRALGWPPGGHDAAGDDAAAGAHEPGPDATFVVDRLTRLTDRRSWPRQGGTPAPGCRHFVRGRRAGMVGMPVSGLAGTRCTAGTRNAARAGALARRNRPPRRAAAGKPARHAAVPAPPADGLCQVTACGRERRERRYRRAHDGARPRAATGPSPTRPSGGTSRRSKSQGR